MPYKRISHDIHDNPVVINQDTSFSTTIFFPDGIFMKKDQMMDRSYYDQCYLKKIEKQIQPETDQFYNLYYWGLFKIAGDTLKLHYISHQPWLNPYWTSQEVWYIMFNERTLKAIYAKDYINNNRGPLIEAPITLEFIETNINLPSDTWLKKKKWFWCNEQEYKLYMKQHKK
ncbi:MAG: hypothetical protein NTU44_02000 [Bacteroidetes bacterium]|nr:hypothetical protein [Bacteroidota bacterium]